MVCYGAFEFYLEMFIELVHQAGEELICILLFSYIQLFVPHLEDLQETQICMCEIGHMLNSAKI